MIGFALMDGDSLGRKDGLLDVEGAPLGMALGDSLGAPLVDGA